ncbi:hypothetical protein C8R44DRAFT_738468 [Mycena epipterygia]|nr:hypothetical protein C8R44DRAFT_738468 [Mycena epipterygia]
MFVQPSTICDVFWVPHYGYGPGKFDARSQERQWLALRSKSLHRLCLTTTQLQTWTERFGFDLNEIFSEQSVLLLPDFDYAWRPKSPQNARIFIRSPRLLSSVLTGRPTTVTELDCGTSALKVNKVIGTDQVSGIETRNRVGWNILRRSTCSAVRTTFTQTTTTKMGVKDFPPELLTRIFLQLSYKSLLSVLAVSVQWNAIVTDDPALSVQMFKKLSRMYVEPGCVEVDARKGFRDDVNNQAAANAEPVRASFVTLLCVFHFKNSLQLHPAVQQASYTLGSDLEAVSFYTKKGNPGLSELAIANDFISIPVVTMITVDIPGRLLAPRGFRIKVKNSKGVRLIDLFVGLATESNREVAAAEYGTMTKADLLGNHIYYEGLELPSLVRNGLGLSAQLWLGS